MKTIIAILIVIIITSSAFLAGKNYYEASGYKKGYGIGYKEAWDKAKALVDSSKFFSENAKTNSISGKIKVISASDKLLTVEADPVSLNPLSDESKSTIRKVKINPDTKIIKRTAISQEETQKILEEMKNNQTMPDSSTPFPPFTEQELVFDQLKAGQRIVITADRDIKIETNITANKIEILE